MTDSLRLVTARPSPDRTASTLGAVPTAELVERARRGDQMAFGELYDRHRGVVHAVALARLPTAEAHDVVQESFLRAMTRLKELRRADAFGPWLLKIARNCSMDVHRRRSRECELVEEQGFANSPRSDAAELTRVLQGIRMLPAAYREVLLMRLAEGMTGPEIAERTGLKPESVRVNLHRGLKQLRILLGVEKET